MLNTARIFILILSILILETGCKSPSSTDVTSSKAKLVVSVKNAGRTIMPSSVSLSSYTLTATRTSPSTESYVYSGTCTNGVFTITNMDSGTWSITIKGLDSNANEIVSGTTTATLVGTTPVEAAITLTPQGVSTGTGSLSLTVNWSSSVSISALYGTLTATDSTTTGSYSGALTIGNNSATWSISSVTPGSYTLNVYQASGATGTPCLTDTVLIYNNLTSTGSLTITNGGFGMTATNTTVTTVAGSGSVGSSDASSLVSATFHYIEDGCFVGTSLYVVDYYNYAIRDIDFNAGTVSTLVSEIGGSWGICSDGSSLYIADTGNKCIQSYNLSTNVLTTFASGFTGPQGIRTDGTYLYVTDGGTKIYKVNIANQSVTDLAGTGNSGSSDGTALLAASFNTLKGICILGNNLYLADGGNNLIRKLDLTTNMVSTIAGSGTAGSTDDIGTSASFNQPEGLCTDGSNLYVLDYGSGAVRILNLSTLAVTTLATGFSTPHGMCTDGKDIYVMDTNNNQVKKISLSS